MSSFPLRLKRVYLPPAEEDGTRVLVERLWPRGLTKQAAAVDHWLKDISPSPGLRKWFGHRPELWDEFQLRYLEELQSAPEAVQALRDLWAAGPVTLVYAARDEARNSALVLKRFLEESGQG